MSTYIGRTVTVTHHDLIVPAPPPWGAAAAEIGKAWTAAERAYRSDHGLDADTALADNALTFHAEDDSIVIRYTTEGAR